MNSISKKDGLNNASGKHQRACQNLQETITSTKALLKELIEIHAHTLKYQGREENFEQNEALQEVICILPEIREHAEIEILKMKLYKIAKQYKFYEKKVAKGEDITFDASELYFLLEYTEKHLTSIQNLATDLEILLKHAISKANPKTFPKMQQPWEERLNAIVISLGKVNTSKMDEIKVISSCAHILSATKDLNEEFQRFLDEFNPPGFSSESLSTFLKIPLMVLEAKQELQALSDTVQLSLSEEGWLLSNDVLQGMKKYL